MKKTYKVEMGVFPYLKYKVDLLVRVDLKSIHKSMNGLSIPNNTRRPRSFHKSTNVLFISHIGQATVFSYPISVNHVLFISRPLNWGSIAYA